MGTVAGSQSSSGTMVVSWITMVTVPVEVALLLIVNAVELTMLAIVVPTGMPGPVNGIPTDSPAVEGVTLVMILDPRTHCPVNVIVAGPVHCARAGSAVNSTRRSTTERMSLADVSVI